MQRSPAVVRFVVLPLLVALATSCTISVTRSQGSAPTLDERAPNVSLSQPASPRIVTLRVENPEGSENYDPLTYNMVVYTRKGLIQTSYLYSSKQDRRRWPECCSISLSPGNSVSLTLPRQRYAVGYVELVSLMVLEDGKPRALPAKITCDVRSMSCRTVSVP